MASIHSFIATAESRTDQYWLLELIAGRVDLLSIDVFPRMEPLFAQYPEGCGEMHFLLTKAAEVYSDTMVAAAYLALARRAIDHARRSARGR